MSYNSLKFLTFLFLPMSSFPSSPVPNSVSSFTALYAHKRAMRTAHIVASSSPTQVVCKSCNGTHKISVSVSTFGSNKPPTITSLDCIHCKDGSAIAIDVAYASLIWCKCKHGKVSGFIHAHDGHRVFGNTTYLCSACGFVKQFG